MLGNNPLTFLPPFKFVFPRLPDARTGNGSLIYSNMRKQIRLSMPRRRKGHFKSLPAWKAISLPLKARILSLRKQILKLAGRHKGQGSNPQKEQLRKCRSVELYIMDEHWKALRTRYTFLSRVMNSSAESPIRPQQSRGSILTAVFTQWGILGCWIAAVSVDWIDGKFEILGRVILFFQRGYFPAVDLYKLPV